MREQDSGGILLEGGSVPDSDVRDRFDDWVVGLQFVPDYLHHAVFRYRTPRVIRAFVR
jgi:hypothetical protein